MCYGRAVVRARGMALAHLSAHPALGGGERREEFLANLAPKTRALVEKGVSPERWYVETHHLSLYTAAAKTLGLDSDEDCFRFFRDAQLDALTDSKRTSFHTLSAVLAQTPVRWRRGHDTGHLAVQQRSATGVEAILRDHPYAEDRIYRLVVLGGVAALIADIVTVEEAHAEQAGPQRARLTLTWQR